MSIRKKIIGGFAIICVLGIILGIIGLVSTSRHTTISEEQYNLLVDANEFTRVLNAHYDWRHLLTEAVLTESEFTGSVDGNTCALGRWRNSDSAKNITDPTVLSLLDQLIAPHDMIHNEAQNIVAYLAAGDREAATRTLLEDVLPRTETVITALAQMADRYTEMNVELGDEAVQLGQNMTMIVTVLLVVVLVLSVGLTYFITTSIMKPIRAMTNAAEAIAVGDLDVNVEYTVDDEIGKLAQSFKNMVASTKEQVAIVEALANGDLTVAIDVRSDKDTMNIAFHDMIDKLNDVFSQIVGSTSQVQTGSRQLADGAQSLAQGSTEQAASIQQLSSSIAEIAERTKTNAATADKTSKLSDTIKESAEKGSRQMDEMITAVKEINDASQSISKIIKTIDDIAFQTNILALNAAVEAARAGQHGKGFAVVAEEVRNLASKSAEAAKDTGDMIQNSMDKAAMGSRIAGETAASLNEIVTGINESSRLISDIARASEEQSLGISQINTGIDQVAQVVQQNSATAEESAAASEEMSGQSDMLQQLIEQFTLKDCDAMCRSLPSADKPTQKKRAMPEKGLRPPPQRQGFW